MTVDQEQRTGVEELPVVFTDLARSHVLQVMDSRSTRHQNLRVGIQGRGPSGFDYAMAFEEPEKQRPDDSVVDLGDFKVLLDPNTVRHMHGATVDYSETADGGGFEINNPNPLWDDPQALRVQEIIDQQINPGVAAHGGFVQLMDVKNNTVYVALGGGCVGCGMVDVTLKQGIEVMLKEALPEIESVVDTTDHAQGTNPYYQPAKG